MWEADGVEEIGYDDLANAAKRLRERLDYGLGSAPGLSDGEREARQAAVEAIVDSLIRVTTVPRTGSVFAIDATGQWAWTKGPTADRARAERVLAAMEAAEAAGEALEVADIAIDDDGATAPESAPEVPSANLRGRCLDAAWGYKTSKLGKKEVGFGFHQHTICRVPDPDAEDDDEAVLVDGFALTPANCDVVDASLRIIDRIRKNHGFTGLIGDHLYTNLKAWRWAVPLAERGIEQCLTMGKNDHGIVDVKGAKLQYGWMHCPMAPMADRPLPPENGTKEDWDTYFTKIEDFQRRWAFSRKESGLGASATSKWVCPAVATRVGCHARGGANVQAAIDVGNPVTRPPDDWDSRDCCTNRTVDFTPDPTDTHHQRKLAQRHYYGNRAWRRLFKRRTFVEGIFGILKNPSRQRLRRGQNRLPGLAMATVISA